MKTKIKIIYVPSETGKQYILAKFFQNTIFFWKGRWELMISANGELIRFAEREVLEYLEEISTKEYIQLSMARYSSIEDLCQALNIEIV